MNKITGRRTDKIRSLDAPAARAHGNCLWNCSFLSTELLCGRISIFYSRVHNAQPRNGVRMNIYMCSYVHLCAYVTEKEKQEKKAEADTSERETANSQIWPYTFNRLT